MSYKTGWFSDNRVVFRNPNKGRRKRKKEKGLTTARDPLQEQSADVGGKADFFLNKARLVELRTGKAPGPIRSSSIPESFGLVHAGKGNGQQRKKDSALPCIMRAAPLSHLRPETDIKTKVSFPAPRRRRKRNVTEKDKARIMGKGYKFVW